MSEVTIERIGRTSLVTFNRPEARNALTRDVLGAATKAIEAADDDVRCIVLTGAGGHFCSGADLKKNLMEDPALLNHLETYMDEFHALIRAIVRSPRPTIAMMDGAAVGFGADIAFACDLRIATPRAYAQEKFAKIGLMPDGGGSFWLPRLVGTARAMRMILLAEKIEANELLELGIVTKLVEPHQLRDATLALARQIEAGPPLAFAAIRRSVYGNWGDIEGALRRERDEQLKLLRSSDAIEGIMAWAQRRDPSFTGS
jgi:2-(1,2-epoxy-1,2-dihydrophenyl)acetyl-CoA isomerase